MQRVAPLLDTLQARLVFKKKVGAFVRVSVFLFFRLAIVLSVMPDPGARTAEQGRR